MSAGTNVRPAGTNVLLCPQNRGPAPTLSYFFRSTWSAAAALGSSSPPSARPRRRPGRFPDLACRRPCPCAPAPPRFLASRHLVPGGLPDPTPAPAAPAPRGRPRAPLCAGTPASSPPCPAAQLPPRRCAPRRRPGPAATRLLDLVQSALPPLLVPVDVPAKVPSSSE